MGVGPEILSDTMGVDFGPYMKRVIAATYRSWIPIIPESARPPLDKQGRVGIRFKIYPDGSVKEMILEFPSGDVSLDRAAWGGLLVRRPIRPCQRTSKENSWSCASASTTTWTRTSFVEGKSRVVPVDPEFRKRQIYGLLVVAVILLLAGLGRSSLHDLFPPGWWRVW